MGHVVLLGDSIFDNARYVRGQLPVIDQLRQALPSTWKATLLAIDGHATEDVVYQLRGAPRDATHLVVSVGGNDALGESGTLDEVASTVRGALERVCEMRSRFRRSYGSMLQAVAALAKPTVVCTVYDAIPGLGGAEEAALSCYNEIILREASVAGIPLIDLRVVCGSPDDYSDASPIEPSAIGGDKIARVIARVVTGHDFSRDQSVIYT